MLPGRHGVEVGDIRAGLPQLWVGGVTMKVLGRYGILSLHLLGDLL
jgi:hypothetical protein